MALRWSPALLAPAIAERKGFRLAECMRGKRWFSTTFPLCRSVQLASELYPTLSSSMHTKLPHPLVILHGLYGSKQNFQSFAKRLQSLINTDVICVDARNHGSSEHADSMSYEEQAGDLRAIYDQYKIDKANIMGHSMGGKVAMCVALQDVDAVNRLVVIDIAPSESPSMDSIRRYTQALKHADLSGKTVSEVRKRLMQQLADDVKDETVRQFLLTNLKQKDSGNNFVTGVEWRCNVAAFDAGMDDITNFPVYHNFFGGPTLFIAGGKSSYIDDESKPEIKRLFPDADIKTIDGAGHWVHADKPQELCQMVADFLTEKSHH